MSGFLIIMYGRLYRLYMNKKHLQFILKAIAIVIVIGFILYANRFAIGNEAVIQFMIRFGYGGIFLASIASGFNLIIPIPIIGFFPLFLEAGFSSALLIIIISVGMVLGDVLGYIIGNAGKNLIEENKKQGRVYTRLTKLRDRHKVVPLFVLFLYASFVPLPNELIVIPMAFIGYRLRYMIIALLLGNIIFNLLVALGFLSINGIL